MTNIDYAYPPPPPGGKYFCFRHWLRTWRTWRLQTKHLTLFSLNIQFPFLVSTLCRNFVFSIPVMISLCFMHNRKKIRPIMIGLKIHEKYFLAWDMVHNETWYINLYNHYFLKKPKALRISLSGALIVLHLPPILKRSRSILGKFLNCGPSWLAARGRLLPCPPSRWPCLQASVAIGETIWNDAYMQFCHNLTQLQWHSIITVIKQRRHALKQPLLLSLQLAFQTRCYVVKLYGFITW